MAVTLVGRCLITVLAVASLLASACTRATEGRPVLAESATAVDDSQCAKVDPPLTTLDPAAKSPDFFEPTIRIPQPDGWERVTDLDSDLIRFSMRNPRLGAHNLAAAAVVTIESQREQIAPEEYFDQSREGLKSVFGGAGMTFEDGSVCGLPAQTIHYTLPPQFDGMPAVPATALVVVVSNGGNTYGIALTTQSATPGNPTFLRDDRDINTGFQVLLPGSGSG